MKYNSEMTFLEHMLELRTRLLKIFFSIIFFSAIGYLNSNSIISFLLDPINTPSVNLQVLKITSIFSIKLLVAFFFGIIISFPISIYHILSFIIPAINNKMTLARILSFILLSSFLFIIGLLFGYYILIPFSVNFFKSISIPLIDSISLNYTLENYLIYLIWILIISSSIYQLPVFMIFFVRIGFLDINDLQANRRYVVVIFFILAAILTPPDPLSQLMIALPLIFLYEITLIIIRILNSKK
tara:strand:+ start:1847 stop:2572 length:726 start_codon:yes stop_codon:yes gene_type:complete